MDISAAKRFVADNARPVDLAVYRFFFEGGSNRAVVSALAAFMLCFGRRTPLYERIVREGLAYLEENEDVSGEALKCFLLAEAMLRESGVEDVIPLERLRAMIALRLDAAICRDTEKYGVEYVPVPSDFFAGMFAEYVTPELVPLIAAEKRALGRLQRADGGFDITWEWGTPYAAEFEQARRWWRPRLTMDKLLFDAMKA